MSGAVTGCAHKYERHLVGSFDGEISFPAMMCKRCGWIRPGNGITIEEHAWKVRYNRFLRNKRVNVPEKGASCGG